jgi:hypothetical protein
LNSVKNVTDNFIEKYENKNRSNIIEWNCKDNNEIILINDKCITLFKLDEIELKNNLSVKLKTIALIKINYSNTMFKKIGQQNKFYTEEKFYFWKEKDKNFILIY